MNNYQNISIRMEDEIVILAIARQDKLNALNLATLSELKSAIQNISIDPTVKALVITGSGDKAFAAGADITEIAALGRESARSFSENGQEIFRLIEVFPKPVIAAVNGYALGGGCELALACHMRIASRNAKLGLPEVSLGILPAFGGTQRLTHLLGKGKALEIMMTGKMIHAEEALALGLVNRLVEKPFDLIKDCKQILQDILKNAPISISKVITSVNAAGQKEGYQVEMDCFADLIETEDFKEGTKAFLEKRIPQFKGM